MPKELLLHVWTGSLADLETKLLSASRFSGSTYHVWQTVAEPRVYVWSVRFVPDNVKVALGLDTGTMISVHDSRKVARNKEK